MVTRRSEKGDHARAITVNEYGAAPALTEAPNPHPGPRQVLIKVEASGMNPMDRSMAAGAWKERMPGSFPFILGADLTGIVEAIGEGAGRFQPGEEVFGQLLIAPLGSAGAYAEYVALASKVSLLGAIHLSPFGSRGSSRRGRSRSWQTRRTTTAA